MAFGQSLQPPTLRPVNPTTPAQVAQAQAANLTDVANHVSGASTLTMPGATQSASTTAIAPPDPSYFNMSPWSADAYQALQRQGMNNGAIVNSDGSNAIPGAQASFSSQGLIDARAGQNSLAQTLATQAAGGGTSAADLQMQQGIQQSILAQQAGAAATGGNGTNPFLMQRQLAMQAANTQQQGVNQAAVLRAQETQAAQQALGSVYQNQVASQLAQNSAAAQFAQQNSQFATTGQTNAGQFASNQQEQLAALIQQARTGTASNNTALTLQQQQAEAQLEQALIGGAFNAAGAVAGAGAGKMDASRAQLLAAAQQRVAPNAT